MSHSKISESLPPILDAFDLVIAECRGLRMYLVRSVSLEDLSAADQLRRILLAHFIQPTVMTHITENLIDQCESFFEKDVYSVLFNLGYRVIPQVGAGQYRIDLVVEGDDARLAIECDGDAFHGPDRWEADMTRQRVLERAGWIFWRCFASSWVLDRDNMIASLIERLNQLKIQAIGTLGHAPLLVEHRVVNFNVYTTELAVGDQEIHSNEGN